MRRLAALVAALFALAAAAWWELDRAIKKVRMIP